MTSESALPIIQNCWVVPDIERAARRWIEAGVGPFLTFDLDLPDTLYRGERSPLSISVALAQAGAIQIELIAQHSLGPSAFRDVVPAGASGFHHICRDFGGYDETLERLAKQGVFPVTELQFGGTRACYADARELMGCMLELVDDNPTSRELVKTVSDASIGWNGTNPIRRHPMFS